jgi:nitroreductase
MHDLFKKRRSVRRFTKEPVGEQAIKEILTAAMVAPSANNVHPVEYFVVRDPETLRKLATVGSWQEFIGDAPIAIVVLADSQKSKHWLVDAAIAAAHIYLQATAQGLGTCWANIHDGQTEKGEDRERFVRRILNLPPAKRIICVLPIGHPAERAVSHEDGEYDATKVHFKK